MLAAQQDGKFSVWLYPNAVYVDRDLLKLTCVEKVRRSNYHRLIVIHRWDKGRGVSELNSEQ